MKRTCAFGMLVVLLLASPLEATNSARTSKPTKQKHTAAKVGPKTPAVVKTAIGKPAARKTKPARTKRTGFVQTLTNLLASLKKAYAGAMDAIKAAYRPVQAELGIAKYEQLEAMTKPILDEQGEIIKPAELVMLPDPARFNIRLRLTGSGRIGEADLDLTHQMTYTYTRKYVAGAMIELGERLTQGSLDIAGITRTYDFQRDLIHKAGRKAAITNFPTHAMAIAFDVGFINTRLSEIKEIIKRAGEMRAEGKIFVNPEAFQSKCLHIVPTEAFKRHFEDVYNKALAAVAAEASLSGS